MVATDIFCNCKENCNSINVIAKNRNGRNGHVTTQTFRHLNQSTNILVNDGLPTGVPT